MSIASRIESMTTHLQNDYDALESVVGTITEDKNIENIAPILDNLWEELPHTTGTGTSLSLATKSGKMKVNLLGNTSQTGTPTPSSPIPVNVVSGDNEVVVCGKNFFNIDRTLGTPSDTAGGNTTKRTFDVSTFVKGLSVNNYYNTGITIDYTFIDNGIKITTNQGGYALAFPLLLKPNTTYTISANISPIGTERLRTGYYQQDGTFISFEINYSSNNYFSFTTPSNAYYTLIHLTPSVNTEVTFTNIMLELGNTATTYQEFQGSTSYPIHLGEYELCKIGNYQDRFIRTSGKNLIGLGTQLNGYADGDLHKFIANPNFCGYYFETINLPNEITIKSIDGNRVSVSYYNSIPADNVSSEGNSPYTGNERTITVNKDYSYMHILLSTSSANVTNIMINEGSTPLPYEPYGTNEWYLEKKIGKVVLDGSETWTNKNITDTNLHFSSNVIDTLTSGSVQGLCNYFSYVSGIWSNDTQGIELTTANYHLRIRISNSLLSDITTQTNAINSFKSWLSTNKPDFYYVLSSPTYTPITGTLKDELEAVWRANSYNGTTNITQVNNDLPFNLDITALEG